MRWLGILLLLTAAAVADPFEKAADEALKTFRMGGDLKALAAKTEPDPWSVADELCARGEFDAAEAFAKAAPRKDTEKLPAYVAARRVKPVDGALYRATRQVAKIKDPKLRLEAIEALAAAPGTVTGIRQFLQRGFALRGLGRPAESAVAFLKGARAAEELGFYSAAAVLYMRAARSYRTHGALRMSLRWSIKTLEIEKLRGIKAKIAWVHNDMGIAHRDLGNLAEAIDFLQTARRLGEEAGDDRCVVAALGNLAVIHTNAGELDKALANYRRVIVMSEGLGWDHSVVLARSSIAGVHQRRGEYDQALELYERSLRHFEAQKNHTYIADTLTKIGKLHTSRGGYATALECLLRARGILRRQGNRIGLPATEMALGRVYHCLGRHTDALRALESALSLARESGDRGMAADALRRIGTHHSERGDCAKAVTLLEQAYRESSRLGERGYAAHALGELGRVRTAMGEFDQALKDLQRALEVYQAQKATASVAGTLRCIGDVLRRMGQYDKALHAERQSLDLCRSLGSEVGEAEALCALASTYNRQGDYARALAFNRRALELAVKFGVKPVIRTALIGIGQVQHQVGDFPAALETLERARRLCEDLADKPGRAAILHTVALIRREQGDHEQSLVLFERARRRFEETGNRHAVAKSWGGMGLVLASLERPAEAKEHFERALPIHRELGDPLSTASTLANIASALWRLGDKAGFEARTREALAICRGHRTPLIASIANSLALGLLDDPERVSEAVPLFDEAIAIIEAQRDLARGFAEGTRATLFEKLKHSDPYCGMAAAQLELGRPALALSYLERGRARSLLDLLARSRFDPLREAERRAREQGGENRAATLRQQLGRCEAQVHRLTHALAAKRAMKKPDRKAIRTIEARLEQAQQRLERKVQERALLVREVVPAGNPAATAEIQRNVGKNELTLYFAIGDRGSAILVVPPAGKRIRSRLLKWPDGRDVTEVDLAQAVQAHLDSIQAGGEQARGLKPRPRKGGTAKAPDLFATLIGGLYDELSRLDRVYIVPHGALHRLPFESLKWKGNKRWIDAGPPIVYTPSASVLLWCKRRREAQREHRHKYEVVALGDPVYSRDRSEPPTPPGTGVLVVEAADPFAAGDVLLAYAGHKLASAKELGKRILEAEENKQPVPVRVWRAGEQRDIRVKPGPLGVKVANEPVRVAWPKLREQAIATLQRSSGINRFEALARLPGTRREVDAIRKAMTDSPTIALLGEDATKARLHALAPRARYLHLATHQLIDESERYGYSRLALTLPRIATPSDDGFLSLFELFEHWRDRLSACELVVLSACETYRGPLQKDEGPFAMPVGFLYAGAPAVIASLWRVDDQSTADLFADFYKRLAAGKSKLEAFTEARQALRRKYPQPYFWAPFIYIGDPR